MDTMAAFLMGERSRSKELMVFDWDKAARLIAGRTPSVARAGLRSDWEWTGGIIYSDGKPTPKKDTYTYLASTWAVPELEVDGKIVPCFKMQSQTPKWDSSTYWPRSARAILGGRAK